MNIFRAVGVLMGMLIAACVAHAYPTLAGFTGNGVLPTGDIVPMNQVQVAVDYYNTEDNDTDLGDSIPIRILYGASPKVEVGVGYMPLEFLDEDANTWNVNAKLATDLRLGGFTWGLGARYASTHVDVVDDTVQSTYLYIAGTRTFSRVDADIWPVFTGTLGINWTHLDSDLFGEGNAFRLFAGAKVTFPNRLSLIAEIQSKDNELDEDALYALVARYPFSAGVTGQVGMTNADITMVSGSGDNNFFAGIAVTFDASRN